MRRAVSGMTLMLLVVSILALPHNGRLVGAQESAVTGRIVNPLTGDNRFIFNSTDHPVNSTFKADLQVANVTQMSGWQVFIEWNNTIINFLNASIPENNVFQSVVESGDAVLILPKPSVGLETGNDTYSVMYGAAISPLIPGVNVPGEALLCELAFTIVAAPPNGSQIYTNLELIGRRGGEDYPYDSYVQVPYTVIVNGEEWTRIKNVVIFAEPAIVGVVGVTIIPEFQSAIILPLLMLLTIFALSLIWKRKVRETQRNGVL